MSNGTRTVVATYDGNNKYVFNSTTQKFDVDKRNSQVNVTVTSPIEVGDNATVTVKTYENATGYVIVNVDVEETVRKVQRVISGERMKRVRQIGMPSFVESLLKEANSD